MVERTGFQALPEDTRPAVQKLFLNPSPVLCDRVVAVLPGLPGESRSDTVEGGAPLSPRLFPVNSALLAAECHYFYRLFSSPGDPTLGGSFGCSSSSTSGSSNGDCAGRDDRVCGGINVGVDCVPGNTAIASRSLSEAGVDRRPVVELRGFPGGSPTFELVLRFVHMLSLEVEGEAGETLERLLKAAAFLEFPRLQRFCELALSQVFSGNPQKGRLPSPLPPSPCLETTLPSSSSSSFRVRWADSSEGVADEGAFGRRLESVRVRSAEALGSPLEVDAASGAL
eukprot:RCo012126